MPGAAVPVALLSAENTAKNIITVNDTSGLVTEIDDTPPTITVNNIENGKYYNQDTCFDVQISDANLEEYYIAYKQDGSIQLSETGNANKNYRLCASVEADYELIAQAFDESRNFANTRVLFGVDKTPPEIHINNVDNEGIYYNEIQPEIVIVEDHPENTLITLMYSKAGEEYVKVEFKNEDTITNEGKYKLSVKCEDKAGNTTEKIVVFELKTFNPADALVFKAEYNADANADFAKGDSTNHSGAKITSDGKGKDGEALEVLPDNNSHSARYNPDKNIDEKQGTIMTWVKPLWNTACTSPDVGRYIFSLYKNDPDRTFSVNFVVFSNKGTTAQIRYMADGTDYVHELNVDIDSIENQRWYKDGSGKWTHLSLSWDSQTGNIKIYIDGKPAGEKEAGKWTSYNVGADSWMNVGDKGRDTDQGQGNNDDSTRFNGYIDRIKIYDKQLTDGQVKSIYRQETAD